MQAQGNVKNADFKVMIEKTIEALKSLKPNDKFSLAFAIGMQKQEMAVSEALSYLDKLKGAAGKFADEDTLNMSVALLASPNPINDAIKDYVEKSLQARAELEKGRPRLASSSGE